MLFLTPLGTVPAPSSIDAAFLQFGAVGAVALVASSGLWWLVRSTLNRERNRADRLEEQLRSLNQTVQSDTMRALNEATKAVADALLAVESIRRGNRREH